MQLFSADAIMWKKIENLNFCPWKHEKTTPKSSILKQKFRCFRNFSLTAQQPKWQNSCSKICPIEKLYIELGLYLILKKSCNISFLSLRAWDESNQVILSITKVDEVLVLFAYAGDPRHNEKIFFLEKNSYFFGAPAFSRWNFLNW